MILNFGHTFAHAIEVKNNYSKNFTHGEAVLAGMILAINLSITKKVCSIKTLSEVLEIYKTNNLMYTLKKYTTKSFLLFNSTLTIRLHVPTHVIKKKKKTSRMKYTNFIEI